MCFKSVQHVLCIFFRSVEKKYVHYIIHINMVYTHECHQRTRASTVPRAHACAGPPSRAKKIVTFRHFFFPSSSFLQCHSHAVFVHIRATYYYIRTGPGIGVIKEKSNVFDTTAGRRCTNERRRLVFF